MRADKIVSKDLALSWLREKIDEGWTPGQTREMVVLTTNIPGECKELLRKILDRMEKLKLESCARKREVKCEDCGYRRVMSLQLSDMEKQEDSWVPGMKCPKCSLEKFYPVVEVETEREPAFQRYWKVNPILSFALILVIAIALFSTTRAASPKVKRLKKDIFVCLACGKFFRAEESSYPIRCKYCGKRSALTAIKCEECGRIFVWAKINREKHPPVCPECGSRKCILPSRMPRRREAKRE